MLCIAVRANRSALAAGPALLALFTLTSFLGSPSRADDAPALFGPNRIHESSSLGTEAPPTSAAPMTRAGVNTVGNLPLGFANEPVVAVDPNNPLHVAAAAYFQLRVSTDGGLTFGPTVAAVLPPGFVSDGDANVAFDSHGRLFWSYLGLQQGSNPEVVDVIIAQCSPTTGAFLPGYPVNVTAQPGMPAIRNHDKAWLAIDANPASPFRDNLYLAWSQFPGNAVIVFASRSSNQGLSWSPAVPLSPPNGADGFVWPVHDTVAPNGDVYVTYHAAQFAGGTDGEVFVLRSTDGGLTWPQKTLAYGPGDADVTFNTAPIGGPANIPGTRFWLQGSGQAYVLADPQTAGRLYIVANDDPDNVHGSGDDANVYIRTSTNNGVTWGPSVRVDHGPGTTFQVMPTAAIDPRTGCIAVHWYDNRSGAVNSAGRYLLDVYSTSSHDGGVTWTPDVKINDHTFDPDPGAPFRFTGVTRIGEYNGLATLDGIAHADWCGNTFSGATPVGQQTWYDRYSIDTTNPVVTCPSPLTLTACATVPASDPAIVAFLAGASVSDECDHAPALSNDVPPSFAVGTTTPVTFTGLDASGNHASCTADVTITAPTYTVTFPPDAELQCGDSSDPSNTAEPTVGAGATFSHQDTALPAGCAGVAGISRKWTVSDECGNPFQTHTQVIAYVDHTAPVIHVTATPLSSTCNPGAADIEAALGSATADDNCGSAQLQVQTSSVTSSGCSRSQTRTWNAQDACSNPATDSRTVTWTVDTQGPTITASGTTLTLGCNPTAAQINAALGTATAQDDCDASVTPVPSDGSVSSNGCARSQTRTWNAQDACGNPATAVARTVTWTVDTSKPVIAAVTSSSSYLWPPNHTLRDVTIDYTLSDNCPDAVTSALSVTSNEPINGLGDGDTAPDWVIVDAHHLQLRAERAGTGTGRIYTVTITATDGCGNTSTATVPVVVAHNITGPVSGNCFKVNSTVNFAGTFWDIAGRTHTAQWTFDNLAAAGAVTEPSGLKSGTATAKYTFTTPGVYKVTLNLTDQAGAKTWVNTAGDLEAIAVIYDPSAGYATGGGWYASPAGAYAAAPTRTGKVSYGFTSKYFKGAANPKGETQLQFQLAGLEFNALNYDYLVVSGTKAQFKGQGKLNGDGSYNFILTVLDGQLPGGGGTDKIRVKIWNKNTGAVVYDTQRGASDAADPTIAVGSGSSVLIVNTNQSSPVLAANGGGAGDATDSALPTAFALGAIAPNPFRAETEVQYALPERARVDLAVYDVRGARVRVLVDGIEDAGRRSTSFRGGALEPGMYFVRLHATSASEPARQFTQIRKVLMLP